MVATGEERQVCSWLRGEQSQCASDMGDPKAAYKWRGVKVECASGMGASKAGVPVALETTSPLHTPTPKGMCAHCYGGSEGGFASDMGVGRQVCWWCAVGVLKDSP